MKITSAATCWFNTTNMNNICWELNWISVSERCTNINYNNKFQLEMVCNTRNKSVHLFFRSFIAIRWRIWCWFVWLYSTFCTITTIICEDYVQHRRLTFLRIHGGRRRCSATSIMSSGDELRIYLTSIFNEKNT